MSRMECIIAPRVPRGLAHAVEGLSREILRQKPRNIYAFAAQHFAKLVELRDKEHCRTDEIVSKILDCKSVNRECDNILDWSGFNKNVVDGNNDVGDVRNWNDRFFVCKYDNCMEKEMTSTIKERRETNMIPKKKKREIGTGIGWSINQTVKVLKKHEYATCRVEESENLCDIRSKRREIEKISPDHIDHGSHQLSKKIICGQCFRSMSADNISLRRNIKDEEVKEKRKKLRNFALDKYGISKIGEKCEKCERNACNLIRQKSADQIERTCIHFKCGNGDGNFFVGRRRSRSLVNNEGGKESNGNVEEYRRAQRWQHGIEGGIFRNLKEQWRSIMIEDEETEMRKLGEKLNDTEKEGVAKLSLRLGKKHEKEELKNNEMEEDTFNDKSRNNEISNDVTSIDRIDISVMLPSVITRPPSSGKSSTGRNIANYEFDERNNTNNFTLPPISSDGSKPMKKENDLTLPFLSNETDIRLNEETMRCRGREESNSNRNRKDIEVIANIDYESKAFEKEHESENSKSDDNDSWKYHWHKCEENGVTGQKMEQNTDEIQVLGELEILESSNLQMETEIEETFKDSLNVTPDSLEYLKKEENEIKEEEKEEEEEEKQEQYRSNELERKLMEIETVEKSIENTLASSQTISTFNKNLEESCLIKCNIERNLESQVLETKTDNENDTMIIENETKRQVACEGEEWTNLDKSERVDGKGEEYNIEIESMEKSEKNCSDDGEIFIRGDNNNEIVSNVRGTCDHSSRREIDLSCYVLTEGSPCEIPESVTTVIIPDKIEFEMDETNGENITNDNDVPCWNKREKEYRDPFGEYVEHSETIDNDHSSSVHAHFLQDIKNTVYRTSSLYQEDLLGNIKEEEENEKEKFCNVTERSVDYTSDSSQAKPSSCNERYKVDMTNDTFHVSTSDATLREKEKKEEGETWRSDRSNEGDEFSSSFEQIGLKLPEFSLNCSRDIETSTSSIQGNDSRNFDDDDRSEKGNDDDVTLYEDENTSIDCKDKQPIEEISLEKNECFREELFIEQPLKDDTIEDKRNEIETSKFEDDKSIEMPVVYDKYGNDSRFVEEEIARELIQNFILDASIIWENVESRDMTVFPLKDPISSTCKSGLNDFAIEFHPSVQESTLETTTIDHLSYREEIDNDIRSCDEQIINEKKKNEVEGRENEQETSKEKEEKKEKGEKEKASIFFFFFIFENLTIRII